MSADDLASDDPRVALKALQRKLAADMTLAEPSVSAQIAGQLRQVLKDLAALPGEESESPADEIAKRRAARLAGADVDAPPARESKQRRPRSG